MRESPESRRMFFETLFPSVLAYCIAVFCRVHFCTACYPFVATVVGLPDIFVRVGIIVFDDRFMLRQPINLSDAALGVFFDVPPDCDGFSTGSFVVLISTQ